ncbi:hypothetical protein [Clostridium sp.]|uniref:hypothetical protein n=1 Tax=Clostridium sp. TaxID=1506 RepID=UPI002911D5F2|nr:hypothetical protein [Clostridium sp.]MDU6522147.1 hypothetical protein [Clostridium sp.]
MEKFREELYRLIDCHGIDFEKLIVTDKRIHEKVINLMTAEEQEKVANQILKEIRSN